MATLTDVGGTLLEVDTGQVEAVVIGLRDLRAEGGRLFLIGNGGGAGYASHAACDFRKIAGIEAYAYDNLTELTARINDNGWRTSIVDWLAASHYNAGDALFVFSVGGGDDKTSKNLVAAIDYAKGPVFGIVGQAGGHVADHGTVITIPSASTPIVEGIQAVLWHLICEELA